jgi:hypothetical protein
LHAYTYTPHLSCCFTAATTHIACCACTHKKSFGSSIFLSLGATYSQVLGKQLVCRQSGSVSHTTNTAILLRESALIPEHSIAAFFLFVAAHRKNTFLDFEKPELKCVITLRDHPTLSVHHLAMERKKTCSSMRVQNMRGRSYLVASLILGLDRKASGTANSGLQSQHKNCECTAPTRPFFTFFLHTCISSLTPLIPDLSLESVSGCACWSEWRGKE